jgi:hypothetical protein
MERTSEHNPHQQSYLQGDMDHLALKKPLDKDHTGSNYQKLGEFTPLFMHHYSSPTGKQKHMGQITQPPPEIIENAEEWEVEEICGVRRFGPHQNWQYLIKWKGYPESDNTWEPIRNLKHTNDAILEYHKQNPSKQRPKQFQG